ncbi:MAG: hypothetical protein HOB37_15925 [Rhodospirillaceae bacterium]|nr:hypothetical protein [Rhodospirillaceae bacterium]
MLDTAYDYPSNEVATFFGEHLAARDADVRGAIDEELSRKYPIYGDL